MASTLFRAHIDILWNPNRQDIGRNLPLLRDELKAGKYEVSTRDEEKVPEIQLKIGDKIISGEKEVGKFISDLLEGQH
ncbi:MAG TPA: hypothetical protein VL944_01350 [Candidatus Acidoferrum sp.]|nr:hypothetical protein [Candidatus Acidoferrum sp.]